MSRRGDRIQGRRAHGGVLLVPCSTNEAYRYWLLADSGAARTMLAQQVAEEIELDLSRPLRRERIASVHRIAWGPVLRLSSLQVGSQRATDLEVFVIPPPKDLRIDGILGVNFLERFRPTLEFDRSTLILR